MSLRDDILPIVYRGRAVAGTLGLRTMRAFVVVKSWGGDYVGDGPQSAYETELLNDGQPPRITKLSGEQIAVNQLPLGTWRIGPLTPRHGNAGTELSLLNGGLDPSEERLVRLTGGIYGDAGGLFRITSVEAHSAFRIMLFVSPLETPES